MFEAWAEVRARPSTDSSSPATTKEATGGVASMMRQANACLQIAAKCRPQSIDDDAAIDM